MSLVVDLAQKLVLGFSCVIVLILCGQALTTGGSDLTIVSQPGCPDETISIPLLPVVFFDSASSDFPERYDVEPLAGGASSGSYRTLHDAYLRVLDVLAEQLASGKDHVVLHGYDGCSRRYDVLSLARASAERIKNFLVYDRGIDARRITVRHSRARCEWVGIKQNEGWRITGEHRRVEILTANGDRYPIHLRVSESTPVGSLLKNATLLSFEFRSSSLMRSQQAQLVAFLRDLPEGCSLRAIGSSDNVREIEGGSLSLERASVVAKYIRALRPDCIVVTDSARDPHSSPLELPVFDLPEIRYLSRSVLVKVTG